MTTQQTIRSLLTDIRPKTKDDVAVGAWHWVRANIPANTKNEALVNIWNIAQARVWENAGLHVHRQLSDIGREAL